MVVLVQPSQWHMVISVLNEQFLEGAYFKPLSQDHSSWPQEFDAASADFSSVKLLIAPGSRHQVNPRLIPSCLTFEHVTKWKATDDGDEICIPTYRIAELQPC